MIWTCRTNLPAMWRRNSIQLFVSMCPNRLKYNQGSSKQGSNDQFIHVDLLKIQIGMIEELSKISRTSSNEAPRRKLRGILRNSPKPQPSFAKATEDSLRLKGE